MTALYSNWLSPVVREKAETAFKANSSSVPEARVNLSRAVTGNDYKERRHCIHDGRPETGCWGREGTGEAARWVLWGLTFLRGLLEAHRVTWKHTGSAQLAAVCDDDLLGCLPTLGAERFYFLHNVHALFHMAKHNMFAVQPVCLYGANEELGAVGVGARIGHGQNTRPLVLQLEVLVRKAASIDGLSPRAVVVGEVTSLAHEGRNHSVECGPFVSKALLPGAQGSEVLCCLWDDICL